MSITNCETGMGVIAAARQAQGLDSQPRLAHSRARVAASRAGPAASASTGRKCAR